MTPNELIDLEQILQMPEHLEMGLHNLIQAVGQHCDPRTLETAAQSVSLALFVPPMDAKAHSARYAACAALTLDIAQNVLCIFKEYGVPLASMRANMDTFKERTGLALPHFDSAIDGLIASESMTAILAQSEATPPEAAQEEASARARRKAL